VLGVSTSGYFEHIASRGSKAPSKPGSRLSDEAVLAHIKAAHAGSKGEYGWPRIWKELVTKGVRVGKDRIQKLMKLHGIKARGKRRYVVTTDSKHNLPIAANLLDRNFQPEQPNAVWTGDITYIPTDEGWLYLAGVIDLHSRHVVGWSMAPHMQTSLVADALRMAWYRRHPGPGLIFHSDRGSQYCSHEFQAVLTGYGMRSSMSRKGNCWDNAPTESFFNSLKNERVHGTRYDTRDEAIADVFDYIEPFYNRKRQHSTLGYVSPVKFLENWISTQHEQKLAA
jgi:transposase InsO family protein